ncbi:SAV_915 family protein [Actinoplanes sp. NPDC049681]|uniref:SAV_915 family protein n=1 Tax=Actinoplanes sp. NPDC049681 TaxID=3363905 RepID=UPI00379506B9
MELPADGDVVFVPARPVREAGERDPAIEVRRLASSGERVGLAFSSVEALVKTLGPFQPWVGLPMYAYVVWLRVQGVYQIQVDPSYGIDVRQWSAEDVFYASEGD